MGGGGEPQAGEEGEEEEQEEEEEREREREEDEESESERESVQDAWVEKGRRPVDFVGNLLSADARTSGMLTSGMLTSGMQSQVCKATCSRLTRAPQVC